MALRNRIETGELADSWSLIDGIVCFHRRAHIPATSTLHSAVLATIHDGPHEGIQKTLHRLRQNFPLLQDREVVQAFVRACAVC